MNIFPLIDTIPLMNTFLGGIASMLSVIDETHDYAWTIDEIIQAPTVEATIRLVHHHVLRPTITDADALPSITAWGALPLNLGLETFLQHKIMDVLTHYGPISPQRERKVLMVMGAWYEAFETTLGLPIMAYHYHLPAMYYTRVAMGYETDDYVLYFGSQRNAVMRLLSVDSDD